MPIYDMLCPNCGKSKEIITMSVVDAINTLCDCGTEMDKIISGGMNFKLKGEGWSDMNYSYEYQKSKASTDDNVKPVYSKKEAQAALKKYKDNTFAPFKNEKI